MSYAAGRALQEAVFAALRADLGLATLVGPAVYDVVPAGAVPEIYVALGEELVRDRSDMTGGGAEHEFSVSVVSTRAGFATAKSVATAVSDVLTNAQMTLARGTLVYLRFHRARAVRRGASDERRITLLFRARTCDG